MAEYEVTRAQRDVLWQDVVEWVLDARDFKDVSRTLLRGDGEQTREVAVDFRRAMRLLDDLGWDRVDPRDRYELTMPPDELASFLRWLAHHAEGFVRDQVGCFDRSQYSIYRMDDEEWEAHCATERRQIDHNLDVVAACRTVLETGASR